MKGIWHFFSVGAFASISALAVSYDAAIDFSSSSNPNGVWSYGWEDSGGFHLFTRKTEIAPQVHFWTGGDGPLGEPTAGKNEGTNPYVIHGSTTYGVGELGLHPGRLGQRAILRWTAARPGEYEINANFRGADALTTTDFRIQNEGVQLAYGDIIGRGAPLGFSGIFSFDANEYVDFSVGFGPNQTFWYDTTLTRVSIHSIPDGGSTLVLLGIGGLSLWSLHRRMQVVRR